MRFSSFRAHVSHICSLVVVGLLSSSANASTYEAKGFHRYQVSVPATVPPVAFGAPSTALDHSSPYSDPNVAVVEFDQHGSLWPCDATHAKCQEDYAVDFLHNARTIVLPREKLIVLTFIHGWLHNADWKDQKFPSSSSGRGLFELGRKRLSSRVQGQP